MLQGFSGSDTEISMADPRPFALELELEAAGDYRVQESSPDSTSERGVSETGILNQDFLSETSPSPRGGFDRMQTTVEFTFHQGNNYSRASRRRQTEFEKRKRLSIFASAVNPALSIFTRRKSLFVHHSRSSEFENKTSTVNRNLVSEHKFEASVQLDIQLDSTLLLGNEGILKSIFLFLSEPELLQSAFLVSRKWADAATQAHAELMLMSVGCSNILSSDAPYFDDDVTSSSHEDFRVLLDKPWDYVTSTYPWARFLSEGGFKQVYKVFNRKFKSVEAISVM